MGRLDKLIAKIRARPPEADFGGVRKLLEAYGWKLDRQGSSHCVFVKAGEPPISVPTGSGRRVKRTYLVHLCTRLGLDD